MLQHNCHHAVTSFEYAAANPNPPGIAVDACKVDGTGLQFARFMWSGSSSNHSLLAKLHDEQLTAEKRLEIAEQAMVLLMAYEIRPEFEQLLVSSFSEELWKHLVTEEFSVEGDELHQLVDCIVLGPYISADLNSKHPCAERQALACASVPQWTAELEAVL
jgi:hypothetical protein